ncbi:WecB/TagA/CpsF family glycosyltransferase [Novosphingobium sp.]|uniref:WecB/TagA/CpsF family glycosyltransferase n=1 Tax=Novosphingobium sp. TaxID=1874826 RepID=UPI003B528DC9
MKGAIEFLGLFFDPLSKAEVEQWIAARDANSPFAYLVTPNVDHVVRLSTRSGAIHHAYRNADLCLCDSRVLKRLAGACGVGLELVTGSDLVEAMFSNVVQPGDRICMIGGSSNQVFKLQMLYPHVTIMHHEAPMGLLEDEAARLRAVEFASSAKARFTLLGVGSPQQELIASEMGASGQVGGTVLCIGASVEFLVGEQSRAPRMVQMASLEWFWRLIHSPRRLARRYLIDGPTIFPIVLRWYLTKSTTRSDKSREKNVLAATRLVED